MAGISNRSSALGSYGDVIAPVLRRAVDEHQQLTPEERANLIAEGESEISRLLDEQSDDGSR